MWKAMKTIVKGIALLYFTVLMVMLAMIVMTNILIAWLQ